MQIKTKFSNGDRVFANGPRGERNGPWLVGKVQVEVVETPGIDEDTIFDNYKANSSYRETYMLVETGIGTGTCYLAENLHATLVEAEAAAFVPYY